MNDGGQGGSHQESHEEGNSREEESEQYLWNRPPSDADAANECADRHKQA